MPSTVEQLSPTRVKITVEVPFSDLKPSMDKAYRDVARSVNIPGFRKGKVPPMVIDQRFGRGAILQEAINDALPQFYNAAVNDNKLKPMAQPDVEVTRLEDGDLIEFTAEVDVRPDFDVPDPSTIAVTVDATEVPDALVDEQIQALRTRFGSRTVVERAVATGDVATVDLVATKDGEALPDATAEGIDYEVGSGSMLEGLDDAIIGLSAGESAEFASTLVGGPLKDEAADITVTVTKVQEQELPEADDELAQQASEFDTIEELRADVRTRLSNVARLEQAARARDAVLEAMLAQIDVEVPSELLESETKARRDQVTAQLEGAGLTLEDYLAETEDAPEDAETFWADSDKRSGDAIKAQMILDKVAEDRDLGIDQNDLTQHIMRKAQEGNTSPQEVANHLQEHPHHIDEYVSEIRRGKALALLVESAEVTDSNGERVDLANLLPDGTLRDPNAADEDDAADVTAEVESGDAEEAAEAKA